MTPDKWLGSAVVQEEVSTYPSEAHFVAKIMKSADAILSILEVVVLDEAESTDVRYTIPLVITKVKTITHPLQRLDLRSIMDLELWMSPKRAPQA
jgi:hypothetical protein